MKEFVYAAVKEEFDQWKARGLSLNMARGKPSLEQLELSRGLFTALDFDDCMDDGVDARNYGELAGMPSARKYWAELLDIHPDQCFVGGSSSLNMMYDFIAKAWSNGLLHSEKPWSQQPGIKFLCPVPGYDRHFRITQSFGIELIPVKTTQAGPDMDQVEEQIKDPSVKGIWCVPKYSNPTGVTYSNRVVRRFARLSPAAPDFRIFWDNAYTIHDLYDEGDTLLDLFALLKDQGKEDMAFIFGSTSKISFAGAGLAAVAASKRNIAFMMRQLTNQTISYDKISQLMHVRFFGNYQNMKAHMKKHAAILRPKFELVEEILEEELGSLDIAQWTKPRGGYFISFQTLPGCAKRIVTLCKEAGVTLTAAGAAFPYGIDPKNSNIRLAPSYPTLEELEQAARLFCLAVKMATVEYLLTTSI